MEPTRKYLNRDPPNEGVTLHTLAYRRVYDKHGAKLLLEGSEQYQSHTTNPNNEVLFAASSAEMINTAVRKKGSSTSTDKLVPTFNVSIKKRYSKINMLSRSNAWKAPKRDALIQSRRSVDENEVRALIKRKLELRSTAIRNLKPNEGTPEPSSISSQTPDVEIFKEDCNRIETVFLNCSRIDRRARTTNLNILMNLYHLVSSGGGTDWKPRERVVHYITSYLCNNSHLLIQLVYIITDSEDFQTCLLAVKTLYLLLIKGGRFYEDDQVGVITALNSPAILETLIESMYFIDIRFLGDSIYKRDFQKLHSQILQMILTICKANSTQESLIRASKGVVQLIGKLTSTCYKNKDLANVLLETLKVLSRRKKNCRYLISKQFFDGLHLCCTLTNKLSATTTVLQAMSKDQTVLDCMSENEKVINLIIDIIYYNGKKSVNKKPVFGILNKMMKTRNATKVISDHEIFDKLYNYFVKSEKYIHRSETITAYTFLNRIANPKVLQTTKLDMGLCLPEYVKTCREQVLLEESDTENDDSEEDAVDVDVDDADDESDEFDNSCSDREDEIPSPCEPTDVEHRALSDMCPFYMEQLLISDERDYSNLYDFEMYEGIPRLTNRKVIENRVHRGINMDKIAYPDATMLEPQFDDHTLSSSVNNFSVKKLIHKLKFVRNGLDNSDSSRVIYDLDRLQGNSKHSMRIPHPSTYSYDPDNNGRPRRSRSSLKFESRFECGNLRKAVQIGKFEYDLTLSPDTNSTKGLQWFYFQVTNMVPRTAYMFNIINLLKSSSQYNHGMQPLMFSVIDHALNKTGWKRVGREIIYYGNNYINENGTKQYKTLSFVVSFQYSNDYVYLAYHYPYTYTRLMIKLFPLIKHKTNQVYARIDKLCKTVNNKNEIALLTITGSWNRHGSLKIPFSKRPLIFITARIHPGETNSSWIMEGIIKFLLSENDENAIAAREHFIFKIIPMLNPEGVIYGNTVYGLTGINLNRCWANPNKVTCPEIYHAKRLVACGKHVLHLPIAAFIDIHGHSKKKFFFFYGCDPQMSWNKEDKEIGDFSEIVKLLPEMVHNTNPNISLMQCKYKIDKNKEGSGRVVMWREFDIKHSFALECSYSFANEIQSINTKILTNIGASVISSLGKIADKVYAARGSISTLSLDYSCNFRTTNAIPPNSRKVDPKMTSSFFCGRHNFEESGVES